MGEIDIAKIIQDILSMSQTDAFVKIGFILAIIGFTIWWKIKGDNIKRDQARNSENRADQINHDHSIEQNRTDNQQVRTDSQRTDDFFKGEKNGRS